MSRFLVGLVVVLVTPLGAAAQGFPAGSGAREFAITTRDHVQLVADLHPSTRGTSAPVIMLFHQGGGDARGEYGPLLPRLRELDANIIAVDLRSGGTRFGSVNRTVARLSGREYSYCDAYADVEATLDYVRAEGFTGRPIAWGSSFSAALVVQLAAKRGSDLAGVLAFSPAAGPPMGDCSPEGFVAGVSVPMLALRPRSEMTVGEAQFELFRQHGIQTYVAENGVHGSSMLNAARVDGGVDAHWAVVEAFIRRVWPNR